MSYGFDLSRGLRRLREHGLRVTQENTSGGGELDIAAMPVKKSYTELSLKIRDLLA
jgi:hypothetical protein